MAHLYPYNSGSRITLRSGKAVYVEKHGRVTPPTNGEPPTPDIPVVFVHGFNYTIKTWVPLLPYFTDYTRIVSDSEPYGRTGASGLHGGRIDTASHVHDIDDILFHFGYASGQVMIVGHSGGTLATIQFAHDFPLRTRKIILLGPIMQPIRQVLKDAAASQLILTRPWEQFLVNHQSWLGHKKRHDSAVLALIESEMRGHEDRREAQQAYIQGLADFEFKGAGGVDVEAWVVKGLQDSAVQPSEAEAVAGLLDARIFEVDTGHFFAWEDLEATVKAVRTALDSAKT